MRKRTLISVLAVVMAVVFLSGCSGSGGFKASSLVNASKKYGISEAFNATDTANLINSSTGSGKSYYVSKDKSDAQLLYDTYINNRGSLPKVEVNEAAIVAVNEYLGDANYTTYVYQLDLNDTESAKDLYNAFADSYVTKNQYTTNRKNGYSYTISYFDGQSVIYKRAAYVKGSSVLFIYGIASGADEGSGFANYIFKGLGVIDPDTLK